MVAVLRRVVGEMRSHARKGSHTHGQDWLATEDGPEVFLKIARLVQVAWRSVLSRPNLFWSNRLRCRRLTKLYAFQSAS